MQLFRPHIKIGVTVFRHVFGVKILHTLTAIRTNHIKPQARECWCSQSCQNVGANSNDGTELLGRHAVQVLCFMSYAGRWRRDAAYVYKGFQCQKRFLVQTVQIIEVSKS